MSHLCTLLIELQASKDCVQKTIKRLEEKVTGKVLHQILYTMYSGDIPVQRCVATALTRLANTNDLKLVSLSPFDFVVSYPVSFADGKAGLHFIARLAKAGGQPCSNVDLHVLCNILNVFIQISFFTPKKPGVCWDSAINQITKLNRNV